MPVDKFGRMSDLKTKDTGVSLTYINNNYVRSDGETPLTGSLDMRGNTLYNVADPVNPQDVVTKVYVDNTKGSGVIGRKVGDAVSIKENLDFLGKQRIKNLPDPVNDHDAVTKEYVDTTTAPFLKLDQTKYNTKGDIDMGDQFTVLNVKTPIDDNHITNKKYVDEMDNLKSAFDFKNGSYYAKSGLIMKKNKLGGLREPLQDGEAATKKYVDDKVKNLFIDENDNITFGLNVDMEGNQILGLPEPATDQEPATKKYVDDLQTQNVDQKGNIKFGRNINLDNKRIFGMKGPTKPKEGANKEYVDQTIKQRIEEEKNNFLPQDPATKNYVDEAIRGIAAGDVLVSKEGVFIKENGHYRATAPLDIDNQKMENVPDPVDEKDAANKKYIDGIVEALTLKQGLVRENGGFNLVDSYINMNFNRVRNIPYPHHNEDAVPRSFLDGKIEEVEEKIQKIKEKSEERPFLKENGNYQASTSINMNFNKLLNLQKPTELYDAVTKDYVDYIEKEIKEKLEKKKQIIAVHAKYCGPLEEGDYPFKFGGNSLENCEIKISKEIKGLISGFVMPHPGYIKKTICEGVAYINLNTAVGDIINSLNENDINKLKLHYKKEDFKNDFSNELKNILSFNVYSDEPIHNKQNSFFEIIKIDKKYHNFIPAGSYTPDEYERLKNLPRVIKTVLIQKFILIQVEVSREKTQEIHEVRLVMQISSNDKVRLDEGETLNIRISNFPDDLFSDNQRIPSNVFKPAVMVLFSKLNFNFTFLIELDPL